MSYTSATLAWAAANAKKYPAVAYAPDCETAQMFLAECAAWKPEQKK